MIILLLLFTLLISIFNAYSVGRSWYFAKYTGGFPYLLEWCGAIMTAIGFSMIWTVVIAFVASAFHFVSPATIHAMMVLYPALIYVPLVLTGFVIMLESWRAVFVRGQGGLERTLNIVNASYNTYAEFSNISMGGEIFKNVSDLFDSDDDASSVAIKGGLLLALFGIFGGAITAFLLIRKIARKSLIPQSSVA